MDGVFTTEDRTKIELLLNPLAIAIRNANMFENAERLTITDDLTKLYNYRYLMKYLESDVKRCLRYKKKYLCCSLTLMDSSESMILSGIWPAAGLWRRLDRFSKGSFVRRTSLVDTEGTSL